MSKEINHWCVVCGKGYHACDSCNETKSFTPWRALTDSIEHFKIFTVLKDFNKYWTVSIGLFNMLEKEYVDTWFVRFCAGAVLVSIPISILFMITQKFYQEAMGGAVKG